MTADDGRALSLRRLALLLGGVCSLVLLGVYVEAKHLFADPAGPDATSGRTVELELPQIPRYVPWPAFDASRDAGIGLFAMPARAVQAPAQTQTPPDAPAIEAPMDLVAVLVRPDERRALVRIGTDKKVVPVIAGTLVAGWKVIAIETDQVTLERGSARKALYLSDVTPTAP